MKHSVSKRRPWRFIFSELGSSFRRVLPIRSSSSSRGKLQIECLEDRTVMDTGLAQLASVGADPATLVSRLYETFLHRAPQAGEVAGWVGQLDSGLALPQLVSAFPSSAEYKAHMIQEE